MIYSHEFHYSGVLIKVNNSIHNFLEANGKPSKFLSPLLAAGHYGILPLTGMGLLGYSIRAPPSGTYGSGRSSPQQVAAYSGIE
jgi:hypothetical protein